MAPPKWKDALLQVARERFAGQQAEQPDAQLMAPISPSPAQLIDRSLELIVQLRPALAARPPDGAPRRLVVDLGCGDGRWLIAAAARFGWRGVGVDLNDALLARGRAAAASDGVAALVSFARADLLRADIRGADVVVAYLFREGVASVREKLGAELRPGAVVVSIGFELKGGWVAAASERVGALPFYVYTGGARGGGPLTWGGYLARGVT